MFMFKVSMCKWYCGPTVLFARNIYFVSILFLKIYTWRVYTIGYLLLRVVYKAWYFLRQCPEYLSLNHRPHLSILRWMWSMVDTLQHYAMGKYLSATLLNFLQSVTACTDLFGGNDISTMYFIETLYDVW
jgi:hypothetical protein